jgi:flagellar biosynthesis component FlhA
MLTDEGEADYSSQYNSDDDSTKSQSDLHSFNYQEIDITAITSKYLTLSELASTRKKAIDKELLATLVDVAVKVRDLTQAIELLKLYQAKVNNPEQFALLDQKRKELTRQVTSAQAIEQASLKLGTELTQSVLDQLLTQTISTQTINVSGEGL